MQLADPGVRWGKRDRRPGEVVARLLAAPRLRPTMRITLALPAPAHRRARAREPTVRSKSAHVAATVAPCGRQQLARWQLQAGRELGSERPTCAGAHQRPPPTPRPHALPP